MKIKFLLPFLLLPLLSGCGQDENLRQTKDYAASEILGIHIQNDSGNLALSASPDEKIHVSAENAADIRLDDGLLKIVQTDSAKNPLEQFSFREKGKLSISLPSAMRCPVSLENDSGDIEIQNISVSEFQLDNSSGYGKFTNLTADAAQIASGSGDIRILDSRIGELNLHTSSGYAFLENPASENIRIATKSGEANLSQLPEDTNLEITTDSGDVSVAYASLPNSLDFQIASGSKDITAKFHEAQYETNTPDRQKGILGAGAYRLNVESGTGTVVIQ